jgi:hypothetical protein
VRNCITSLQIYPITGILESSIQDSPNAKKQRKN